MKLSYFKALILLCFVAVSFLTCADQLQADVTTLGDVSPAVPDTGGNVGGVLTIGDTDVAGLFMDIAPPLSGTLEDLESTDGVIGNGPLSIGAAVFDDFGVRWIISDDLMLGVEGQGFLDVFDSASIEVADETIIGMDSTGQGNLTLNGSGSRLLTDELTVGDAGQGILKVLTGSSLQSTSSATIGSTMTPGDGRVEIIGFGSRWMAQDSITIGGLAGDSHGILQLFDQGLAQVEGTLTVNPRGTIELNDSTLRMLPQATNTIINDGLIHGDGLIDGGITNGASGQIRNAAGIANEREYLRIAEEVSNIGLIESIGGEMEFENLVTNTTDGTDAGDIVARNAIMRFRAKELGDPTLPYDLIMEDGAMYLKEETTVYGDINLDFSSGGTPSIIPDPEVLIVGSISVTVLAAASTSSAPQQALTSSSPGFNVTVTQSDHFSITGSLDLGAGITDLGVTYDDDEPTEIGDMLTVITADGGITGEFSNDYVFVDNLYWEIDEFSIPNTVFITAIGSTMPTDPEDLNGDGFVDGLDLGILLGNWGATTTPDMGELDGTPPVDGLDLGILLSAWDPPPAAATAAVPEPTTALLMMMGIVCVGQRKLR